MLWVPVPITLGVYVDVHVAGLLALSVHAVNVPVPLLAGVIVPPDALLVPLSSLFVAAAVAVVESFTVIDAEALLTVVVVVRGRTGSAEALVVLPAWIESLAA